MKMVSNCSLLYRYEVPVSSGEDPDTIIVPIYMKEKKYAYFASFPERDKTDF